MTQRRRSLGMTLMELLVAVALLGIAVPLAYRGLAGLLQASERTEREMVHWQALAFFFERLETDLAQAISRGARDRDGALMPPWKGDGSFFEFSRISGSERAPARQRFLFRDGRVWLMQLPLPDRGVALDPEPVVMLDEVTDLQFSYLDVNGGVVPLWQDPVRLPSGLALDLTLPSGERITRLFALP